MKTVIMAGGKGTRISSINSEIPKPLIPICGTPVLEREIICLRDQGFKKIIITVGYKGQQIIDYFGDGSHLGVEIEYFVEHEPLGNAGALFRIREKLNDGNEDNFLLLNADSIFDVDFNSFVKYHKDNNAIATIFTHPNSHPYDSSLIIADEEGVVKEWLSKEDIRPKYYKNRVNAGLHVINKSLIESNPQHFNSNAKIDLDRMLLKPLAGTGKLLAYNSPEYVKDMGTPDRYYTVCEDYKKGIVQGKNLLRKQKAIFLDRDGTINVYKGFLKSIKDFELIDGVSDAIKAINASGYLAIVITNQPVIARGEVTRKQLTEIHNKMETLLGKDGAYVDDIFYCPHHPDKGFEGEIISLKIDCDCRKPKPGMLYKAAEKYNIDLTESWMVGDDKNDMLAGMAAGCKVRQVGITESGEKTLQDVIREIIATK